MEERLRELDELRSKGLVTEEEYKAKHQKILDDL
ncbi:MAG TPA: SHOCT domain-containing protein [Myxococcota bacterium]|nr:SHOCT domain-containing protein [Myxococcota bacterium]